MAEMPNPNPTGNEETPTPTGTEGEPTPQTPQPAAALTAEEQQELMELREIKATTGFKKFTESAKEANRLLERNKELEEKLAQAGENSLEKDLSVRYPDWDLMTESEKILAKNQERIDKQLAELAEEKAWDKNFTKVRSKYSKLADKENEFKEFCNRHPKGVDTETLAKSFLFDDKTPVKEETKERKGLERPTAGPNKISTPGMTLEDIKRLREEQPKLYAKMLKEGRLNVPKE
jgi:hypothetical protein